MEPELYKAAAEGNIEPFQAIANDDLSSILTPNRSTVLHVYIASQTHNRKGKRLSTASVEWILERCPSLPVHVNAKGEAPLYLASQTRNRKGKRLSTGFVIWILEKCPSLLVQVNANRDAPLHVAAKCGHPAVVEVLIEFAKNQSKDPESNVEPVKQMLGMTNVERNTALHEAVRSNSIDVVKILMEVDTDFPYSANSRGQTPLYMAAEKGSFQMVAVILQNCSSVAHEGPDGKNALHAAARVGGDLGVIEQLLRKKKDLIGQKDGYGWTPLHHAAYSGNDDVISMLLRSSDASYTAYIGDEGEGMTALYLAASQGKIGAVREIIRLSPECCDMVDYSGWNILHHAMVSMHNMGDLKDLMEAYPRLMNLINEKDLTENTPLHVFAALRRSSCYELVPPNDKGDYGVVNYQNISVRDVIDYGYPELVEVIENASKHVGAGGQYYKGVISISEPDPKDDVSGKYEEVRASHLVVAALIATVSFAAAFTIPGGYNSSNGIPILRRNKAFQAFIISDTIAMLLSLSAVFIHFMTSMDTKRRFLSLFAVATWFTMISMGAMVIAFVTGTYAMLAPSLGLAITVCLIALCFFFVVVFIFRSMYWWIGKTFIF